MLIESYQERMQRSKDKKQMILKFLRDETWTNIPNIQQLLDIKYVNAHRTLSQLQRDGMVRSHTYRGIGGQFTLWGITPHGLAFAFDEDEPWQNRSHFEPSKVALSTLDHTLDIQLAHIKALKAGWTNWVDGRYLPGSPEKRPDGVVNDSDNKIVAIEIERTIKTKKRYEMILSSYLQAIKRSDYDYVIYLSPSELAPRLERYIKNITEIPVSGERVAISGKHFGRFQFLALEDWLIE